MLPGNLKAIVADWGLSKKDNIRLILWVILQLNKMSKYPSVGHSQQ